MIRKSKNKKKIGKQTKSVGNARHLVSFQESTAGIPSAMQVFGGPTPSPFGATYRTILTCRQRVLLTTAAPGFSDTVVWLNRLYQPLGGAGEYAWFPELNEIWTKYRVLSSSLSVQFHPTNGLHYNVAIAPKATNVAINSVDSLGEYLFSKSGACHEGGNFDYVTLTSSCKTNQIQEGAHKDENFVVTTTGSPADPMYWHIAVQPTVNDQQISLQLSLKLCAEVLFTDLDNSTGAA